jgi:hypothetical protein
MTSDDAPNEESDDTLNEDEAARFLGVSTSFLAKRRCRGDGPVFVKYGGKRIGYLRSDLKSYRAARRRTSTAAPAPSPTHAA